MFKRFRQYNYIKKIRKAMADQSMLRFLILNGYKSSAASDLLNGRITRDFYSSIFCGGTISVHYTEVNAEAIKNYRF